jgi:hypothetical protein
MSYSYQKWTEDQKVKMEREFRHLLSIIPVWRQKELFVMEMDEAKGALMIHEANFEEHWSEKNPAIPTPKRANKDA